MTKTDQFHFSNPKKNPWRFFAGASRACGWDPMLRSVKRWHRPFPRRPRCPALMDGGKPVFGKWIWMNCAIFILIFLPPIKFCPPWYSNFKRALPLPELKYSRYTGWLPASRYLGFSNTVWIQVSIGLKVWKVIQFKSKNRVAVKKWDSHTSLLSKSIQEEWWVSIFVKLWVSIFCYMMFFV